MPQPPPARSAACPPKTRQWRYAEGERAFSAVQKGWSRARVLTELGGPDECQGTSFIYIAGPYTGPELRVTYTFAKDRVVNVTRTVTGCRLVE